jgi:hypothetical protein
MISLMVYVAAFVVGASFTALVLADHYVTSAGAW